MKGFFFFIHDMNRVTIMDSNLVSTMLEDTAHHS